MGSVMQYNFVQLDARYARYDLKKNMNHYNMVFSCISTDENVTSRKLGYNSLNNILNICPSN